MQFRKLALALPAVLALAAGQTTLAHAQLTITANYDVKSGATTDMAFQAAVQNAINQTLSYVTTSTPVNDVISFVETPGDGLGGSGAYEETINYSTYYSFLQSRIAGGTATALETTAFNSMPVPDGSGGTGISTGTGAGTSSDATTMRVIPGLANAIGQGAVAAGDIANGNGAIGTIYINTSLVNDNRAVMPTSDQYDTQAVVQHEIDELLGVGGQGTTLSQNGTDTRVGILDLFRYSSAAGSPVARSYTNSTSANSYFSIDGGKTNLDPFNQQGNGGADYADWGDVTTPQVQDAFGATGVDGQVNLGAAEIDSFDVAGYKLTSAGRALQIGSSAAPEPSSLLLILPGVLTLGGMVIRRRKQAIQSA